jgi:hypothetical protein
MLSVAENCERMAFRAEERLAQERQNFIRQLIDEAVFDGSGACSQPSPKEATRARLSRQLGAPESVKA